MVMGKRAFLIHGWEGRPSIGWIPWLKNELEKRGFVVFAPAMPDTNHPKMDAWVNHLAKIVGTPDEDCYFVGHSLGCITILRYLEKLKEAGKIGGAILVAGFSDDLGIQELKNFFTKPIEWKKIRSNCKNFAAVHSDNDKWVPLKHGETFRKMLRTEVVVQHGMKHYGGDDGVTELPVTLSLLLKFSRKIKK